MKPSSLVPYLLAAPAAVIFGLFLLLPLGSTALLSGHSFDISAGIGTNITSENYAAIFGDNFYLLIFWRTIKIALITTFLCIAVGAPEAYIIKRMRQPWRRVFFVVAFGPLLISVVCRTLGWALLLGSNGVVSQTLLHLGVISEPFSLMYTETGVVIALTHVLVPYVVIAVWTSLQRINPQVEDAALSLGAGMLTVVFRIVLPQVMPGILSGGIIVFALAASAFATPQIIGGSRLKVASTLAYDEFLNSLNWPLGAAIAVLLCIVIVTVLLAANRYIEKRYAQVFQ